jgi:hypothetical protein
VSLLVFHPTIIISLKEMAHSLDVVEERNCGSHHLLIASESISFTGISMLTEF